MDYYSTCIKVRFLQIFLHLGRYFEVMRDVVFEWAVKK